MHAVVVMIRLHGVPVVFCINDQRPVAMPEHDIGLHGWQEADGRFQTRMMLPVVFEDEPLMEPLYVFVGKRGQFVFAVLCGLEYPLQHKPTDVQQHFVGAVAAPQFQRIPADRRRRV